MMGLTRKGEGDGVSILAYLVIGAAFVLLMVFVLRKAYIAHAGDAQEAQCRDAIRVHSRLLDLTADTYAAPVSCQPKKVTVRTADQEAAKRQLAEAMRQCWDRWGRGELTLFQESGLYCNPCAFVSFEGSGSIDGLDAYLEEAIVPGTDATYADYMLSRSSEQPGRVAPPGSTAQTVPVPTDKDAAILFVYAKGSSAQSIKEHFSKDMIRNLREIASSGAQGAAGGAAVGVGLVAAGVCTGTVVCGVVVGGVALVAGGGAAVADYFWGTAAKPEHIAFVMVRPNDAEQLRALNCKYASQGGPAAPGPRDAQ